MSFQAYIDNIRAKTGKTPEDFRTLARKEGLLEPGVTVPRTTSLQRGKSVTSRLYVLSRVYMLVH